MSAQPKARETRVQHVPGVDDSYIVDRFIGGDTVAALAHDYSVDGRLIELAIRAWAEPYWHLDHAASQLFDRWLPLPTAAPAVQPPQPKRYRDDHGARPLRVRDIVICIDETGAPLLEHGAAYEVLSAEEDGKVVVRRIREAGEDPAPQFDAESSRMRWSGT